MFDVAAPLVVLTAALEASKPLPLKPRFAMRHWLARGAVKSSAATSKLTTSW
jgi:hypothetical protein